MCCAAQEAHLTHRPQRGRDLACLGQPDVTLGPDPASPLHPGQQGPSGCPCRAALALVLVDTYDRWQSRLFLPEALAPCPGS